MKKIFTSILLFVSIVAFGYASTQVSGAGPAQAPGPVPKSALTEMSAAVSAPSAPTPPAPGPAPAPQPGEKPEKVAECEFKRAAKGERVFCSAFASDCRAPAPPAPSLTSTGCKPKLKIRCNDETIFRGAWVGRYKDDPERFVIKGKDDEWNHDAPRIEILLNGNGRYNSAYLFLDKLRLRGSCELFQDLEAFL